MNLIRLCCFLLFTQIYSQDIRINELVASNSTFPFIIFALIKALSLVSSFVFSLENKELNMPSFRLELGKNV